MVDAKDLRQNPDKYRAGARAKQIACDIDGWLALDARLRGVQTRRQELTAEKNKIGKDIGMLAVTLKKLGPGEAGQKLELEQQMKALQARPTAIKAEEEALEPQERELEARRLAIWLTIPQPPDADVPTGGSAADNKEIRRWAPAGWDFLKTFRENKGFAPRTHVELCESLGLVDHPRGVKMAGSRSYVLTGLGMQLHNAVLQFAFRSMVEEHKFSAMSVPVLVREEVMTGTGFFPAGREQAYEVPESARGGGHDLYLTGTGEVGLMGFHEGEILEEDTLPRCYTTVSTCFRREAGAAGRDTAGLYRIHQFDKVEQVVLCRADEAESRRWHTTMIGYVEQLLQRLDLPYRLLQCCTGDLGPKNADMVDIECWMPGRGDTGPDGRPKGEWGETHSASRLYDFQCRRLNLRYREKGDGKDGHKGKGEVKFCHSLNNTVIASPRVLIPILEHWQNADGSVTVPPALRPFMGGIEVLRAKGK